MIKKSPIKISSTEIQKQRREIAMMKFARDVLAAHQNLIAKLDETKKVILESKNASIPSPFKMEDLIPKKGWDYFTPAEIEDLINLITERIGTPKDGEPGKPGKPGTPGKNGTTPVRGVDYFTPEDVDVIIAEVLSLIPPSKPGEPGAPGKNAVIDYEQIVKDLVEGKYLKPKHIDGLEQTLSSMWNQVGKKGYLHGGGDTIRAGTSITLTRNSDGTTTISSAGGFTEIAFGGAVNSANVTYTVASIPTYIVADGVNLKRLDSNGNAQWSFVGLTITMVNPPSYSIFGIA